MRPLDSSTLKKWNTPILSLLLLLLLVVIIAYAWWRHKRVARLFVQAPAHILADALRGIGDTEALLKGLSYNLGYLDKKADERDTDFAGLVISTDDLKATTEALIQYLNTGGALDRSREKMLKLYEVKGGALVTGYYLPEFEARKKPVGPFSIPVYGVPSDLVTVRLKDFVSIKGLEHVKLRGRVKDGYLVPYYTRAEIRSIQDLPVIAYLADPLDHLVLQIQGSGILIYADGERSYCHYAADNGHPYVSIGKVMIEMGLISPSEADWQGIRMWFQRNPGQLQAILDKNPRFIFFKEDEGVDQAIGAQGTPLTPLHSIAVDPGALPFGGIYLLEVEIPGKGPLYTLTMAQDVGGAIKGPHHIDLYLGRGKEAGEIAGRMRARGRLWLVLLKRPSP